MVSGRLIWAFLVTCRLEDKRTELKLAFADKLRYPRGEGFRTADLSMPFKMLDRFYGAEKVMARPDGLASNEELFEELARWNDYLKADQAVRDHLRPPCP